MDTPAQVAGRERLDEIVADRILSLPEPGDVDLGPMFSTIGWRVDGRVFAFVARSGELLVKLPEERVAELVQGGDADPMNVGRRTMREWARIPAEADWDAAVVEAHRFGAGGVAR